MIGPNACRLSIASPNPGVSTTVNLNFLPIHFLNSTQIPSWKPTVTNPNLFDKIKIRISSFTPRSSISTVEASIDTVCPALTAASGTSLSSYKFVKNKELINVDFPRPLNKILKLEMVTRLG